MDKSEALSRWVGLEPNQPVMPHFTPIAADAHGSTFGACGIRISGNPAFVDAVLSRLKDVLDAEGGLTRLVLSRQPVKPVSIKKGAGKPVDKHWDNAEEDAEVCYIQIRERNGTTRRRRARESTPELPRDAGGGPSTLPVKPVSRMGDLFDSAPSEGKSTKSKGRSASKTAARPKKPDPEPAKVAHIGSRNGEVIWDDEDSED